MIEGLPIGAAYALVAVGYSMVYGILKLINFAHSEIFMLGAFFTWSFLTPAVNYDPATHVQTLAAAQFWSTALYLAAIGYVVAYRLLPRRLGAARFAAALPALAAGGGLGCWLSYVHVPFLLALALSMTAIGLLGIAIDTIAYKALRNARRLNLLITAIGMSIFLVNATQITFGEQSKSYANDPVTGADLLPGFMEVQTRITDPAERQSLIARGALKAERRRDFFTGAWEEKPVPPQPRISNEMKNAMSWTEALRVTHEFRLWGDNYFTPRDMALILAALVCLGLLRFVVMNTRLGMMMRACSTDLEAARLMGINVEMVIAATFFLGSAMAGLAGGLFSLPPQNLYPTMGFEMGIIAFSAAVMGGIGNLPGAALGGLILGVADNFIKGCAENFRQWLTHAAPHLSAGWVNAFDLSKWSLAFAFLVLIVTVLVRPQGLMNVKTGDRS
ncbi:MAG: branched-chain amino acid ABC transporter permease [Planctomycetota bacterium]